MFFKGWFGIKSGVQFLDSNFFVCVVEVLLFLFCSKIALRLLLAFPYFYSLLPWVRSLSCGFSVSLLVFAVSSALAALGRALGSRLLLFFLKGAMLW
jgi:hypothetical protein